ncbi:MAG: hypothetical protein HDR31_01915, partial [Mycoplasma sp.]|nr:hypothetical protein [Mycoplasma sp.]
MKNNIEKIKKLRKELKEVVNEYNSIDSDFDLSSNVELLNEEAKELNQILGLLDKENSNLENRIEFLKEDVNKRIEKLASENPFKTILKKFQKIYGKDSFNVLDLNNFYDSQNEKNLVSNKNFSFKKTKNANQYFNTLFEQEIESIKNISSNKQDFILNNFDINTFSSLPKEEKLFYIFSKIDELKEKFQINLDFELAKNDSQGIDYHTDNLLINNILEVISNSYDELKNEFTKKISWDEFVENESNFNKGKTLFDMKTGNFKNLISNVEQLENKYRKRLSELFNSPVKNKFIDLINDQSLDFQNYQLQIKKLFESSYSTNYSLFKVKFDLSLNSYLKFIESIEVQVENIQNENSNFLSKNKESFLLAGKEKDLSIESAYNNELCEIAKKFILQVNLQQEIITNYSSKFLSWINSISYESDYDLVISKITNETKQSLQLAKDVFASLKKELKSEVKTLKQTLYINKESEIYLNSEQIIGLLTKGIDSSEKNLVNDLEECLEQIQDFFKDFLSKKYDLINEKLLATQNFEINNNKFPENILNNKLDSSLDKNDSNVLLISLFNKKIESLEEKFANFASVLENINNKLNKKDSEEADKNYIEEISKNINNKFEELLNNLKAEMNSVSENNHNFVSGLIENNNKEREYITDLLHKIDDEYQNTLDELELRRIAESNKKLQDLENLIVLQNQELQELLDDKNEVFNKIEQVVNSKAKNEKSSENLEKAIEQISKNFELKIDSLESKFNEKLEEINVNSMILSTTDNDLYREITRNISELENQLSSNYESVKNSFKENFTEIISKINSFGESSSHGELLNKKIEELNILLDNLKEKNEESLQNIAKNLKESSKKDMSEIIENFNDKLGFIGEKIESKVDWYETNRQEELNNLSEKLSSKLEHLITEKQEDNQRLVSSLIESNNKEREYIVNLLHKIDDEYQNTLDELELRRIAEGNKKLHDLENLIVLQNNELQELLDDKNEVFNQIEKAISKKASSYDNSVNLEKTILEISKNFESRIDSLESRFNEKLEEINVNSLTLSSTDNDLYREITRNISELESQLSNNYESVKNSFKENFSEIINKIEYGQQGGYSEILNRKIQELNILVDSLKSDNQESLQNITKNIDEASQRNVSQILDNLNEKIGSIGEKIENKVDWYETNRQEELSNLSEKISNRIESLIHDINIKQEDNQNLVFNLIESNNKERDYVVNLLNKIDSEYQSTLNELELKVIADGNRKIESLEGLIILQNNELQELLDDKNNVINEIENAINRKVNSQDSPVHLEKTILE